MRCVHEIAEHVELAMAVAYENLGRETYMTNVLKGTKRSPEDDLVIADAHARIRDLTELLDGLMDVWQNLAPMLAAHGEADEETSIEKENFC